MLTLLLLACAPSDPGAAPTNWFYADQGDAIDWQSVAYDTNGNVIFRTAGAGLRSGPVDAPWTGALGCEAAARLTVAFVDGEIDQITTAPDNPCVADVADRIDWSALDLDGIRLDATHHALVVLDVPGEEVTWASS